MKARIHENEFANPDSQKPRFTKTGFQRPGFAKPGFPKIEVRLRQNASGANSVGLGLPWVLFQSGLNFEPKPKSLWAPRVGTYVLGKFA